MKNKHLENKGKIITFRYKTSQISFPVYLCPLPPAPLSHRGSAAHGECQW